METNKKHLWGALVGLVRAMEGNEHFITQTTEDALRAAIACPPDGHLSLAACHVAVMNEKRRLVPDCFVCLNNCGRTADYDLAELRLDPTERREMKETLMDRLPLVAETAPFDLLCDALFALGTTYDDRLLRQTLNALDTLAL